MSRPVTPRTPDPLPLKPRHRPSHSKPPARSILLDLGTDAEGCGPKIPTDFLPRQGRFGREAAVETAPMQPSGGIHGTWWLRSEHPHPVVEGVDFVLDSERGGGDEVYFVPDSDEQGAGDVLPSEGFDRDEIVPDSEAHHAVTVEEGSAEVSGVLAVQPQLGGHRPLQRMFREWRVLLEDEKSGRKDIVAEVKPSIKEKILPEEMPSIEDAETDDEGVDVRGHSQVEEYKPLEDDYITELLTTMIPAYDKVSKRRNIKD